ncbi:transcriptional regulator, MerR family [Aquisalimonas asiatica]|uniref:Transcriptional regulator, MerR family n=2 Tax=Aquisalimonas asiatica TaxID=406100 RepID=A0A1H8TR39_9GAMM|nr:transcriptional regulator, MerR family [Aquisalimonas asiatica]
MTGVNPVTLRAWERRYGLIRPQRTPKGHRLYTERDIDRINQILVLLDRGIPISQARQVLDEGDGDAAATTAETTDPGEDTWSALLTRMRTGVTVYDEQALSECYEEACSLFAPSQVQHHLLAPLYRQFPPGGSADDQAARAFLHSWLRTVLSARMHHRCRRAAGPRVLLATTDSGADDIPLLLLGLQLIDHGFRTALLGCAVDTDALATAARQTGAESVLLWTGGDTGGTAGLNRLAGDVPVFVAGNTAPLQGHAERFTLVDGEDTGAAVRALDTHYNQRQSA